MGPLAPHGARVACATSQLARAALVAIVRGDTRLLVAVLEERERAEPPVALPSARSSTISSEWASERGADAILARDASSEEIVAAIVTVAAGLIALQPQSLDFARESLAHRTLARPHAAFPA
ncbi:MAG: hypothetical protein NVSMB21_24440 [Vulcanimicrobiaceae bacterium]